MNNFIKDFENEILENNGSLELATKSIVKKYVTQALNSVLKTELTSVLGYEKYDSAGDNYRNGYYTRKLNTSVGEIEVDVPRDRNGKFESQTIPKYSRRTDFITSIILKLYGSNLSHDEITYTIESLYAHKYSKSTISNIVECLSEDVKKFKESPLESDYFCIYLDSTYIPVRRNTVEKEAVNIAYGINK